MAAYHSPDEAQADHNYVPDELAQILDEAIKLLQAGYTLEDCQNLLPQQSSQITPILEIANQIHQASLQNLPPECEKLLAEGRSEISLIAQELQSKPALEAFSLQALRRIILNWLLVVLVLLAHKLLLQADQA